MSIREGSKPSYESEQRTASIKRWVPMLALCALTASCTTGEGPESTKPSHVSSAAEAGTGLTDQQIAVASSIARKEAGQFATSISSATVSLGRGPVADSNMGHDCTSDTVLMIKLIGDFNIVHGGTTTSPTDDTDTIHGVSITADAQSGEPCLMSVQTGHPEPEPGAVTLFTH